ncbi:MAG: Trm112 family protein [Gemmatimonadetes bacterium]|nr:Trm112 family protein [Gemmatimonadota bacterium]
MTLSPQLLAILVCPRCKGPLEWREELPALDCPACRLRFPVRDDIPIMLVDEAGKLPG